MYIVIRFPYRETPSTQGGLNKWHRATSIRSALALDDVDLFEISDLPPWCQELVALLFVSGKVVKEAAREHDECFIQVGRFSVHVSYYRQHVRFMVDENHAPEYSSN